MNTHLSLRISALVLSAMLIMAPMPARAAAKPKATPTSDQKAAKKPTSTPTPAPVKDPAPATNEVKPNAAPQQPSIAAPAPAPAPPPRSTAARVTDAAANKVKVAVMDLRGSDNLPKEMLSSISSFVAQELEALGPFKAISSQEIVQMLSYEATKQSLGCDDVSCLAELGGALGADYLVSGSMLLVGSSYLLQLQLMNIRQARADARVSRDYQGGLKGLFDEAKVATKLLMRDILAQKSGQLKLLASEEGATVKVDGSIVGVSPLPPLEVSGGMHTVALEKTGFILSAKDVEIREKQETLLTMRLEPSEELKRQLQHKARTVRAVAWSLIGLGVAGAVTSLALGLAGRSKASDLNKDIASYNAQDRRLETQLSALNQRQKSIATMDVMTLVTGGIGLAALGIGLTVYLTGDNPRRYETTTKVAHGAPESPAQTPRTVRLFLRMNPGWVSMQGQW